MRKTALLILFILVTMEAFAQENANLSVANKAFDAWQVGEKTGKYKEFKTFLDDDFNLFSHPLLGIFKDEKAKANLLSLIAEREVKSNNLDFSSVQRITGDEKFVFLFDSKGTVSGGFPYQGFNIIVLTVKNQQLVGFQEYFGFVDPNWFK